jgi:hypothetical protein
MPTKMFYAMRNNFISEMQHPKKAWKTLEKHGKPNFNGFPIPTTYQESTHNVEMYGLKLGGKDWGGVIICGQTEELAASFKEIWANKKAIRVFVMQEKEQVPDPLLVYFVRGKTSRGKPETMIAIGCKMKWWGCIPPRHDPDTYKPGEWNKYPSFLHETTDITFKELAENLDYCATDSDLNPIKVISW